MIRLSTDAGILDLGLSLRMLPGAVTAIAGVTFGEVAQAIYAGWAVQPVLGRQVKPSPALQQPLDIRHYVRVSIPLAMTSVIRLFFQPVGRAALSRIPLTLESLAIWPVIS